MSGEVYPGGPIELPCVIELGGVSYRTRSVYASRLAWYISSSEWERFTRVILDDTSLMHVDQRVASFDDPLDVHDLSRAGVMIAIRLAGLGDGIGGWRKTMHMCAALINGWKDFAGILINRGVDPARDQLWRVMAVLWGVSIGNHEVKQADRMEQLRTVLAPLPIEPYFLEGAGKPVADPVLDQYDIEQFETAKRAFEGAA